MTKPLLCATVAASNLDELRARRDAVRHADLIELRLDGLRDPDVAGALAGRRLPVIVTCRPRWEGGRFDGSEEERRLILSEAHDLGAEYIDVEWAAGFDDLVRRGDGKGVVLSFHDLTGMPSDLDVRWRAMLGKGCEVTKIAVLVGSLRDTLALGRLGAQASRHTVVIGLGAAGLPSRVLAARFRSRWMYAAAEDDGELNTPGQLSVERMVNEFRFRETRCETDVYALLGSSLEHSVSPAMHNRAFQALGLDAVYVPLQATDLGEFWDCARALGVKGASVTAPFKKRMFETIDSPDTIARQVGAVNTLRMLGATWQATNTDADGFLIPLRRRFGTNGLRDLRASIIGAGGAAQAVACGLTSEGISVTIHARRLEAARDLAAMTGAAIGPPMPTENSWDLLVNATPIGTYPDVEATPVPEARLRGRFVYDLVYNPPMTRLLKDARRVGCEVISGLEMLVAQARLQSEWWTGQKIDEDLFRHAALRTLARHFPAVEPSARP